MRSASKQREKRRRTGAVWALFAAFLFAVVYPACDWACAFTPHGSASASIPATLSHTPPIAPAQPSSHSCHQSSQSAQQAPSHSHPQPSHPDSGQDNSRHDPQPAGQGCCAAMPDAEVASVASVQAAEPPLSSQAPFFAVAVLPTVARMLPPDAGFHPARDGTRSTLPPPLLPSSLLRRGPPAII